MKNIFSVLISLLVFSSCSGKTHQLQESDQDVFLVNFVVSKLPDQQVYLAAFERGGYVIADSTFSANGTFYFDFQSVRHPGMYRVYFGKPDFNQRQAQQVPYIEFLWNKESFTIAADLDDISGSVVFENSRENEVLGVFREYETGYEQKMGALYPMLDRYPEEDDFLERARKHFMELQEERDAFILDLAAANEDLYVAGLIRAYRSIIIDPEMKGEERVEYMKYHFFNRSPIDKPALIYAPVYNYKIIEYLSLYRGQEFTYSEQEDAFIEATDVIMANVSGDSALRTFVVEYLLEGFNSFQMERVQTYIAENYVDETCVTDAVELAMQRVEGYKKMELGKETADIRILDINNREVRLSKLKSDYTVVVFWATHCGHCVKLMPKLKEWYEEDRPGNVELLAISIDTVKSNWQAYVRQFELPGINAHEPLGWEGRSATDYNVYATPTMFVLDRKRVIRAKPLTYRELKRDVEKIVK